MPRKRTGSLVWTGAAYSARVNGGSLVPLLTADLRVAKARLREYVALGDPPTEAKETFEAATRRIVEALEADGMVTASERLSRLERLVFPLLGSRLVDQIKPSDVGAVLENVAAQGYSRQSIIHVRNDVSKIFAELLRDEIVTRNPARAELIRTPRVARDKRRRALLTDEEFAKFVAYCFDPIIPVRSYITPRRAKLMKTFLRKLAIMAICSRGFGGMRTSDLHAWLWTDVDLMAWTTADVPRPKTEHAAGDEPAPREKLEIPEEVKQALGAWWVEQGRPTTGNVFPIPSKRISYARKLRAALLAAGIDRHELHLQTETTKPVDFHSFRRAFVTAIGKAGLNAQTAMRLTGHKTMATHMRYNLPDVLEIPAGAVPSFGHAPPDDFERALATFEATPLESTSALSFPDMPASQPSMFSLRPHRDLNPGYRRERPVSNLGARLNSADSGDNVGIIELSRYCAERLRPGADRHVVVSQLSFQLAADAGIQAYLIALADSLVLLSQERYRQLAG
jgi:integrase